MAVMSSFSPLPIVTKNQGRLLDVARRITGRVSKHIFGSDFHLGEVVCQTRLHGGSRKGAGFARIFPQGSSNSKSSGCINRENIKFLRLEPLVRR